MTDRSKSIARVQFLGTQRISIGAEVITPESERLFAMIVRLSVPLGRLTSRQTMLDLLWPGAEDAPARHNLRQTVYKARELGLVVESDEDGLRLDPRHWSCDWEDAIGDVPGEWLSDYEPAFADELRAWIGSQRIGVHAQLRPRLIRTLQSARSSGDLLLADRHAVQLLRVDELNEEATLTRAEVMALQGAKIDALKLLDAYLHEIGRLGSGKDAALPAQLLRRRIAEKLPALTYNNGSQHYGPLVARSAESKLLLAGLFDARAGRGTATLVHGAEGVGKSRLLLEAKRAAILQGMRVLELSCESSPQQHPMSTLREVASRLLDVRGSYGISPEAMRSIRAWLISNEPAPDDCPLLEIEDLLASVSEEAPLLLLMEHAEHMDAASLGRLDRVYRRGVSRYHQMILTSSTYATPSDAAVTLNEIERLALRPMTLVEVRDVVTAFAAAAVPRATSDQIACAAVFAEGNPMYGVEMLGLILDDGSPDVIPWRVKVAVERVVRRMSELELRVLALSAAMQTSSSQDTIAASLDATEEDFRLVIDELEAAGVVRYDDGRLHVSQLLSAYASALVRPSVLRRDLFAAGVLVEKKWRSTHEPHNYYDCVRLFIRAKREDRAFRCLDVHSGALVRCDSATRIVFEFSRLRASACSQRVRQTLDAVVARVQGGSHSKRLSKSQDAHADPASFPTIPGDAIEIVHLYASRAHLKQAQGILADPEADVSQRLSEATLALVAASNLGDNGALESAFRVVNTLRLTAKADVYTLCRADVIYYSSVQHRSNALASANRLARASRRVRDVLLACIGLRNAAEAQTLFGQFDQARTLLHEARDLGARLHYPAQVVTADLRLADLAIDEMDVESARAHLRAAANIIEAHQLGERVARADYHFHTCWEAVLSCDTVRATKAARNMQKLHCAEEFSNAQFALFAVKLASHTGPETRASRQDFDALKASIGNPHFAWNSQRSLAALILYSARRGNRAEIDTLVDDELAAIEQRGQRVWPFLRRAREITA